MSGQWKSTQSHKDLELQQFIRNILNRRYINQATEYCNRWTNQSFQQFMKPNKANHGATQSPECTNQNQEQSSNGLSQDNDDGKNTAESTSWQPKPMRPPAKRWRTKAKKEEKAQLWKEYRQKMKPFKNKEYANAKRSIQRLGKLPYDTLDEKARFRLDRAREVIAQHKKVGYINPRLTWVRKSEKNQQQGGNKT